MDPIKDEYAIFKNGKLWNVIPVAFESKEQAEQTLKKYDVPLDQFAIMHRKVFIVATPWKEV